MAKYGVLTILRSWCLINITMLLLISTAAISNVEEVEKEARDYELNMVTCYLTTRNPECFKFLNPVCGLLQSSAMCAPPVPPPHPPALAVNPPPPSPPTSRYAVVALQWSMGLCKTVNCNDHRRPDKFTLHGVWPTYANGTKITHCESTSCSFSQLKKLKDLNIVWPSFEMDENINFWMHEWNKHGKCSELSCYDYFHRSLQLSRNRRNDVLAVLRKKGIEPRPIPDINSAPLVQSYFDAIYYSLNLIPKIKCKSDGHGNRYLVEIQLCATFDLKSIRNCSLKQSRYSYIGCGRGQDRALFYFDPHHGLAFKNFY